MDVIQPIGLTTMYKLTTKLDIYLLFKSIAIIWTTINYLNNFSLLKHLVLSNMTKVFLFLDYGLIAKLAIYVTNSSLDLK